MYPPRQFREERPAVLAAALRDIAFASLVAADKDGRIEAVHLPLLADHGATRLEGHVALANPFWRIAEQGGTALAIFQGPHAYVHPGWYPSKRVDGRAVPTWNYVVVEARGDLSVERDPDWLRAHVAALTDRHEAERDEPWRVDDAPADYRDRLLRLIVGVRLSITAVSGTWKMAQHHPDADRQGVIDGLAATGRPQDAAVARIMQAARD